jgi:mannose-1-phosphate guanylyltransferase
MPKAMLEVGGKPLIQQCIEQYRDCGFKNFVLLLRYHHEKIENFIGDGTKFGINVKYSIEPEDGMGKGKALKYALEIGAIDKNKRSFICFPDDIILDDKMPLRMLLHHMHGVDRFKCMATIVFVSGTDYPFGVGRVDKDGIVSEFREKPFIQELTSTGMYVLDPDVYELIKKTVDLKEEGPIEFENSTLPVMAEMKRIYSMVLSPDCWVPINTQKEYESAVKKVKTDSESRKKR